MAILRIACISFKFEPTNVLLFRLKKFKSLKKMKKKAWEEAKVAEVKSGNKVKVDPGDYLRVSQEDLSKLKFS